MFQEANECIDPVILGNWVHPGGLCPSNPRHLLCWHNSAQWPAFVQVTPDTTFTVWLAQSHRNLETIAMAFVLPFPTPLDANVSTGSLSLDERHPWEALKSTAKGLALLSILRERVRRPPKMQEK